MPPRKATRFTWDSRHDLRLVSGPISETGVSLPHLLTFTKIVDYHRYRGCIDPRLHRSLHCHEERRRLYFVSLYTWHQENSALLLLLFALDRRKSRRSTTLSPNPASTIKTSATPTLHPSLLTPPISQGRRDCLRIGGKRYHPVLRGKWLNPWWLVLARSEEPARLILFCIADLTFSPSRPLDFFLNLVDSGALFHLRICVALLAHEHRLSPWRNFLRPPAWVYRHG